MNKDRESQLDIDTRFSVIKDELVRQLGIIYAKSNQQYRGIVASVISSERDNSLQSLVLGSDGRWGGRLDMMGVDLGDKPDKDMLIREYAEIKDEGYQEMRYLDDDASGNLARDHYLSENHSELFDGLVSEMEARLKEFKNATIKK